MFFLILFVFRLESAINDKNHGLNTNCCALGRWACHVGCRIRILRRHDKRQEIKKKIDPCSESSETSRKLKISKKKIFSYDQKILKNFQKFFFQIFFESYSESSET